jgi:hypothetical protein
MKSNSLPCIAITHYMYHHPISGIYDICFLSVFSFRHVLSNLLYFASFEAKDELSLQGCLDCFKEHNIFIYLLYIRNSHSLASSGLMVYLDSPSTNDIHILYCIDVNHCIMINNGHSDHFQT